jgi:hypothetical protein
MGTTASKKVDTQQAIAYLDKYTNSRNDRKFNRVCEVLNTPVYILTLEGGNKRHKKLATDWSEILGSDIERYFFYGIHGRRMWGDETNKRHWDRKVYREFAQNGLIERLSGPSYKILTNAEIAIAFGMLQIFVDIVKQKHEYALIMEDDANLLMTDSYDNIIHKKQTASDFITRYKCLMRGLPKDWGLLRLGACFSYKSTPVRYISDQYCDIQITRTPFALCNHGFLITLKTCKMILKNIFPLYTTLDHQILILLQQLKINHYDVHPHFLGQDLFTNPEESVIGYSKMEQIVLVLLRKLRMSPRLLMNANLGMKSLIRYAARLTRML